MDLKKCNGYLWESFWKIYRFMKGVYFGDVSDYRVVDFE